MRTFWALLVSVALHLLVIALLFLHASTKTVPLEVSSVPVEILSELPSRSMAEAPVDELAVKTPAPEPAPIEEPKPAPPTPAPPKPVPEPQKPKAKPVPEKTAKPATKEGLKKPAPKEAEFDPTKYAADSAPSRAQSTKKTSPSQQRTTGASNVGNAPQDSGAALNALTRRLQKLWSPNCDVPGGDLVSPKIQFAISPSGRVIRGPTWVNRRNDPVWEAGAARAIQAVNKGQPYDDLPETLYNIDLHITFDGRKACQ